jgi:hypothetical protein
MNREEREHKSTGSEIPKFRKTSSPGRQPVSYRPGFFVYNIKKAGLTGFKRSEKFIRLHCLPVLSDQPVQPA